MVGILIVLITDGLVPHQDVTDLAQLKNDLKNTPFLVLTGLILALIGAALASYLTRKIHKRKNIAQLGIAVTAGSFGALSNVLGKSAIEIVKEVMCSGNWSLLADVFAYVIIGSMIVTLICQVCSLNTGLSNYETMVITSSTNATLTIVGTIESIVYFEVRRVKQCARALCRHPGPGWRCAIHHSPVFRAVCAVLLSPFSPCCRSTQSGSGLHGASCPPGSSSPPSASYSLPASLTPASLLSMPQSRAILLHHFARQQWTIVVAKQCGRRCWSGRITTKRRALRR